MHNTIKIKLFFKKLRRFNPYRANYLHSAGLLLEHDDGSAEKAERYLKGKTVAKYMLPFVGAGAKPIPVNEKMICSELKTCYMPICVPVKNISIDSSNSVCRIKLNKNVTVSLPIKNGNGIKSVFIM